MTIKFFPLFFKSSLDLTPRGVQLIYVIVPLLIAIFTKINEKIATILGRIQTILLSNIIGVSLLCTMSILVEFYKINTWYIVVPVYLVRTGIMNSTYALQESVLMDFVPKETRARWKSLESPATAPQTNLPYNGNLILVPSPLPPFTSSKDCSFCSFTIV